MRHLKAKDRRLFCSVVSAGLSTSDYPSWKQLPIVCVFCLKSEVSNIFAALMIISMTKQVRSLHFEYCKNRQLNKNIVLT